MKLIVTDTIKRREFDPLRKVFSLEIVKAAAKKSLLGLGDSIKSSSKITGTILKKVYLTSSSGAGRSIFLIEITTNKAVLVMMKHKNDKETGANMTVKNLHFKNLLDKNLDIILLDLKNGNYEEYDLQRMK